MITTKTEINRPLTFENMYDDGFNLWFTEYNYNSLLRMNKKTYKVELVGIFPNENYIQERLYTSIVKSREKLYFAPYTAKEIGIYNLQTGTFEKKEIRTFCKSNNMVWEKAKFIRVISVGLKIYFIPCCYPGILCYNIETDTFTCFDEWIDKIEEYRTCNGIGFFLDFEVVNDKLILPCICADAIVVFDLSSHKSKVILTTSSKYKYKYCGICHIGGNFYLLSADGTIIKGRTNFEKQIKKISLPENDFKNIAYYPMKYINGYIFFSPYEKDKIYKIDIITEQVTKFELLEDEKLWGGNKQTFLMCLVNNNKLYLMTGHSKKFIEYDSTDNRIQKRYLSLQEFDRNSFKIRCKNSFFQDIKKDCVKENDIYSLDFMLHILKDHDGVYESGNILDSKEKGDLIYKIVI